MKMIEQELGRPWQQVYAELTPRPIAAASLGQVRPSPAPCPTCPNPQQPSLLVALSPSPCQPDPHLASVLIPVQVPPLSLTLPRRLACPAMCSCDVQKND